MSAKFTPEYATSPQLPGVRIPIRHPDEIVRTKPDYVFILPWNLREEIMEQLAATLR